MSYVQYVIICFHVERCCLASLVFQMEHNIQTCLNFLLAKGVAVQDVHAKEIREGNLKSILGLFFQLSRYKQQQKMLQQQSQGKKIIKRVVSCCLP